MHYHEISTVIPQYLEYCLRELGHTPKSIDNYARELGKFARTTTAVHVEELTIDLLNQYFRSEEGRGLQVSSVNTARRYLRQFVYYCQYYRRFDIKLDYGMIKQKRPGGDPKVIKFATVADVKVVVAVLEDLQDRLIVITLFCAGLRISELVHLRVEDVKEGNELYVRGKGNKGRVVPIPRELHVALMNHIYEGGLYTGALFRHRVTRRSLSNKGYTVSGLRNRFIRRLAPYGIYPAFHWYRHGIATSLYEDGADLLFIRDFLGHSDIRTTQIYAHVSAKRRRTVYDDHFPKSLSVSDILDKSAHVC